MSFCSGLFVAVAYGLAIVKVMDHVESLYEAFDVRLSIGRDSQAASLVKTST